MPASQLHAESVGDIGEWKGLVDYRTDWQDVECADKIQLMLATADYQPLQTLLTHR